nr:MAG TPA: hypothetical protein [Caudoviricetes sp.]DAV02450.1 MAG TPA: hypothetical protein [Caudoviricetes sp.]
MKNTDKYYKVLLFLYSHTINILLMILLFFQNFNRNIFLINNKK